jgi:hypothetical protein
MTTTQSTINFMYWLMNYNYGFIAEVWSDEPWLASHLNEKFKGRTILNWFFELDTDNKRKLVNWVNENYSGGIF